MLENLLIQALFVIGIISFMVWVVLLLKAGKDRHEPN